MKIKHRIAAGFMSAVMAVSLTSFPTLGNTSFAAATESLRVKWAGYKNNVGTANFDLWDGITYNTDWTSSGTGTADSPYIVKTANELMGIAHSAESGIDTEGKFFKLDTDVDISGVDETTTAYLFSDTTGLNADFDLNDHVIRYSNPLFTEVTEKGALRNGTLVASGCEFKEDISEIYKKSVPAITTNNGTVDDIDFMSNMTFEYGKPEFSANAYLVDTNNGTISNTTGYCGVAEVCTLTNENTGEILGCTSLSIAMPQLGDKKRYALPTNAFVCNNQGLIKDFTIDQDTNAQNEGNVNYYVSVIGTNSGTIDHLVAKDMTIYTAGQYYMVNLNTGTMKNLEITGVTFDLDTNNAQTMVVCYDQKGIVRDSKFDIKSHSNFGGVICMNGTSSYGGSKLVSVNSTDGSIDINENTDFSHIKEKAGTIHNCDIDIEYLPCENKTLNSNVLYPCYYVECDVRITGMENAYPNSQWGLYFCDAVIDTNIYMDVVGASSSLKDGDIFHGDVIRSNIHIGSLDGGTCDCLAFSTVYYSNIEIDELRDYGGEWAGLCAVSVCTDIVVHKATGKITDFASNNISNKTRYMITYGDEIEFVKSSRYTGGLYRSVPLITDSEFYFFFDENTTGQFNSLFQTRGGVADSTVKDCFIYIGEMPDGVSTVGGGLVSVAGTSPSNIGCKNITLIAPHINVDVERKSQYNGFFVLADARSENNTQNSSSASNCYVEANLYFKDTDYVNFVSASAFLASSRGEMSNNSFTVNVYDANGNDLDMPVYASGMPFPNVPSLTDVLLRSNTLSAKSALFYYEGWNVTQLLSNHTPMTFKNSSLILPNAGDENEKFGLLYSNAYTQDYDSSVSDETIGVVLGIAQKAGFVTINDCKVFGNSNGAYTTPLTYSLLTDDVSGYSQDVQNSVKALKDSNIVLSSEADEVAQDISLADGTGDTTGKIAYLLDDGSSNSRTYNYTVADETCFITNPFTNEKIYTLMPITLTLKNAGILDKLDTSANLNPVFKATTVPTDLGHIELQGIGNTVADATNTELYAKQDAYLVSDVVTKGDRTFLKAVTQTINGTESVVPNTPLTAARNVDTSYTIDGYTQPRNDVILTPDFDTWYRIDVDIEGSENGTIVPSADTAVENEAITLASTLDKDYKFVDLKINGNPLDTTDTTQMNFAMPANDVKITGKCVALDTTAKITSFEILDKKGVIDEENKTITVTLPTDTTSEELKDVIPEIVWKGESISPDEDEPQDFNNETSYTVTAENPDVTATYTIIIKFEDKELDKTAKITSFELLDRKGVIDETAKMITVTLPASTTSEDLTSVVPEIIWQGESISPDEDAPQNFNGEVKYTVTAEDPTVTSTYSIVIKFETPSKPDRPHRPTPSLDKTAKITSFELLERKGVIDEETKKITVTLPADTTSEDLKEAIPNIVWEGESISPDEDEPQNFNKTVEYTVTAEDPSVKVTYQIVIEFEKPDIPPVTPDKPDDGKKLDKTAKITYFEILEKAGVIDEAAKTITVTLPADVTPEQLKGVIPVIRWEGESINPDEDAPQNFNKQVIYTVTAEDPSVTAVYTIVIKFEEPKDRPTPPPIRTMIRRLKQA